MHEETKLALEQGPQPLPWTIAILLLSIGAIWSRSLILGMIAGLLMGAYTGHYHGRIMVLRVWRHDLELENEALEAQLDPDIETLERERIQAQQVCTDKSHWS